MNIILLPDSFLPNTGGLELAVANLAKEFKKRGHNITIITGRWPSKLPEREKYEGIDIYRMRFKPPSLSLRPFFLFLTLGALSLWKLCLLFWKIRPDIVNIHFIGYNAFYALLASALTGVRIVTSIHGSDITVRARSQVWFRILDWFVLKASKNIISNSSDLLQQTISLYGKWVSSRGHIIGNGVLLEKFKKNVNSERYNSKKIVSIGRLEKIKGHDLLVRAMIKITACHPTSKLIIVGDGPEMVNLKEFVKRNRLDSAVEFKCHIPNNEIPDLLETASVFIQPSRKEAFGISVLEAMAACTPVIASRTGGLPELVINERNGLLVAVDNVEDIAESAIYLLGRPEECEKMGIKGRLTVENNFTLDIIVKKYLDILEKSCTP